MGLLCSTIEDLEYLLAATEGFQRFVGADGIAAARRSIHLGEALDDGSAPRPRAILGTDGNRQLTKYGTTGWSLDAGLTLILEGVPPEEYESKRQYLWFLGHVEAIVTDLMALSGTVRPDGANRSMLNVVRLREETPALACEESLNQGVLFWYTQWAVEVEG